MAGLEFWHLPRPQAARQEQWVIAVANRTLWLPLVLYRRALQMPLALALVRRKQPVGSPKAWLRVA